MGRRTYRAETDKKWTAVAGEDGHPARVFWCAECRLADRFYGQIPKGLLLGKKSFFMESMRNSLE